MHAFGGSEISRALYPQFQTDAYGQYPQDRGRTGTTSRSPVGVAVVAWFPFSWFYEAWGHHECSAHAFGGSVDGGALRFWSMDPSGGYGTWFRFSRGLVDIEISRALYPQFQSDAYGVPGFLVISLPDWLLAFLCLAWPVTSFVIARRRRGERGFEVGFDSDKAGGTAE